MLDFSNFIVRISGHGAGTFYIDCCGLYKISDIAAGSGIKSDRLGKIYAKNGGEYNRDLDIYYFHSTESAKKAISDIYTVMQDSNKGKSIFFTDEEIGYLRKALINDASAFAGYSSRTIDNILKKLNK